METTEYKSRIVKTVFITNTSAKANQPFMEVKHGDDIIGCVYKGWDSITETEKYSARDFNGNPIFEKESSIDSLETNFIINAEAMSKEMIYGFRIAPVDPSAISQRESEIKQLRRNKNTLEKQITR